MRNPCAALVRVVFLGSAMLSAVALTFGANAERPRPLSPVSVPTIPPEPTAVSEAASVLQSACAGWLHDLHLSKDIPSSPPAVLGADRQICDFVMKRGEDVWSLRAEGMVMALPAIILAGLVFGFAAAAFYLGRDAVFDAVSRWRFRQRVS
jgi:hypothetical protein